MIVLNMQEIRAIAIAAMNLGTGPVPDLDALPMEMQLQIMGGTTQVVRALQNLGYRVSRPLALIPGGQAHDGD